LKLLAGDGRPPGLSRKSKDADAWIIREFFDDAGWGPLRWSIRDIVRHSSRVQYRRLRMQHWCLALLCGIWPITSLALLARRARKPRRGVRAGRCRNCGYDLRATPDGAGGLLARCPE